MGVVELLERVQYLADPNGKKKAVVVDYAVWEQLVTLAEDAEESHLLREAGEEAIHWRGPNAHVRAEVLDLLAWRQAGARAT